MSANLPPRSGRALLLILVAVLVVVAIPVVWIWARPATQPDPDAGREVAEAFLAALSQGRPEAAWDSATAEFKSARGRESFLRDVTAAPWLAKPLEFISTQTVTVQDEPRSEYLFRSSDGPHVRLILGREAGQWKVDRWTLN